MPALSLRTGVLDKLHEPVKNESQQLFSNFISIETHIENNELLQIILRQDNLLICMKKIPVVGST